MQFNVCLSIVIPWKLVVRRTVAFSFLVSVYICILCACIYSDNSLMINVVLVISEIEVINGVLNKN